MWDCLFILKVERILLGRKFIGKIKKFLNLKVRKRGIIVYIYSFKIFFGGFSMRDKVELEKTNRVCFIENYLGGKLEIIFLFYKDYIIM